MDWLDHFPSLRNLAPEAVDSLITSSRVLMLEAGQRVFGPGSAPTDYLLLLEGRIRVQQLSEAGREIVLYRISPGESCALTTACLMSYENYPAEAVVEEQATAVAIASDVFDQLVADSAPFRRFVFTAFSQRVTNLFRVIEEVAFERIDIRLAQKLLALVNDDECVVFTHQQLAVELGSAREVISRHLREFQRRGWVTPGRGQVLIEDRSALQRLASSR